MLGKAMLGGNHWYYFSRRTPNRISTNGYWQPLGVEEPILTSNSNKVVGLKRYLIFYLGEAPLGIKTNWSMHEYSLSDTGSSSCSSSSSRSSKKRASKVIIFPSYTVTLSLKTHTRYAYAFYCLFQDSSKWVLCRVFETNDGSQGSLCDNDQELSCLDEVFLSLDDDFDEINYPN